MSVSCPDCFSNLLCCEGSDSIFPGDGDTAPQYSSDFESKPPQDDAEECIAGLLEDERDLSGISALSARVSINAFARTEVIAWMFKVQRYYGFQPVTAYLSVTYFDRFLLSCQLPNKNGWPEQLLAVVCLSLAAKMEESLVPSLLNFQVEDAKFLFEPSTIQRMELLVLRVLDWRLRSISPFCYLKFFALKIGPSGAYLGFLTSKAKDIILSAIQEISFLEHRPSTIAAAAILSAASDLPDFSSITAQEASLWCNGLQKETIMSCQQLIQNIVSRKAEKRHSEVYPQLSAMSQCSESGLHSFSSSSSSKRRKLENGAWVDNGI